MEAQRSALEGLPGLVFVLEDGRMSWHQGDLGSPLEGVPWTKALGLPPAAAERVEALAVGEAASFTSSGLAVSVRRRGADAIGSAVPTPPRTDWLNAAAHELATPLTPIRIRLRELLNRDLDAGVRRSLAVIERNFDRLAAIVDDLLEAERIEGAPPVVHERLTDVDAWLQRTARQWGIDVARRSGAVVPFDAEHARHVLERLVARLRERGHERIEVGATVEDGLCLQVRGDRRHGDGDGDLGLRLAESLAQVQGGRLRVTPGGYDLVLPGRASHGDSP